MATAIVNARAYDEERRRAEALAEIDRVKTMFFSNVSHELRTPLTLILGPIEDALGSEPPALAGEGLLTVHRNARRLLKLVNALLDFARLSAGRAQASYQPTDLAELTCDLASAFRSAFERAELRFEVDCPPLPERICVDRDMWEKIVLNLLSNALKFTLSGGVKVALRWAGDGAELAVSDTGIGIPAHDLPRAFERFHRVQGARARTHEGSGIGLALVQDIVRLHGGTIGVTSEVGRGTTFTLRIPRGFDHLPAEHVAHDAPLAATVRGAAPFVEEALRWVPGAGDRGDGAGAEARDAGLSGAPGVDRSHILLVDDNADMRDYLARLLRERWSVETAEDGAKALAVALDHPPDLVVTDLMMPGVDGFGLLRELRADPRTRDVPVVALSARAGEDARIHGLKAGFHDYLVKPFTARELLARVDAQLARARIRGVEDAHRRRLASIFQSAPVGIAVLRGPDHTFKLANPDYVRLVSARPLLGRTVREAFPELSGQGIYELLDHVFATGEPYVGRSRPITLARSSGVLVEGFVDFMYQPFREDDGHIDGIVVVAFDVTELAVARREAEMANRAKDEFLAMLGHELRNPLAPIVTALHLMSLRSGNVAEKERAVIGRQVEHLTRLVDDLLDVSRIARGKIELRRARVELSEVVARAIETSSALIEQRRHALDVRVPRRGLVVDGDPARLAQIVSNLLGNAAKYTNPNGHIAVTAEREGAEAVLRVKDDGIGIAPDMLPRVFELFEQDSQSLDRSQGGLGLGLAIVRSLAILHGGSVTAQSEGEGRGSELLLRLPLASPVDEPVADSVAPPPPEVHEQARGGGNILVVDDNEDAAELLAEALATLGYDVRVAGDGAAALRLAGEVRPRLMLIDIGLPVMDGYELARRLREEPAHRQARLVAITGYGQESDRLRSKAAGFDLHLVKPVDLDRLIAIAGEAMSEASRAPPPPPGHALSRARAPGPAWPGSGGAGLAQGPPGMRAAARARRPPDGGRALCPEPVDLACRARAAGWIVVGGGWVGVFVGVLAGAARRRSRRGRRAALRPGERRRSRADRLAAGARDWPPRRRHRGGTPARRRRRRLGSFPAGRPSGRRSPRAPGRRQRPDRRVSCRRPRRAGEARVRPARRDGGAGDGRDAQRAKSPARHHGQHALRHRRAAR